MDAGCAVGSGIRNFDPMQGAEEEFGMMKIEVRFESDAGSRNDEGRDSLEFAPFLFSPH
jgi:hypothetical protein